jgi:hypothetical protein
MIRVDVYDPSSVAVLEEPSWWERWIRRRTRIDDRAIGIDALNGTRYWIWDSTWRRICDPLILDAIHQALARFAATVVSK